MQPALLAGSDFGRAISKTPSLMRCNRLYIVFSENELDRDKQNYEMGIFVECEIGEQILEL